ncbi:hypothetical protein JVU11DRAFT_7563 [Chiua virens]|nr:hypothetical protein JVU11DRAFT_7563 [Chiua virens]
MSLRKAEFDATSPKRDAFVVLTPCSQTGHPAATHPPNQTLNPCPQHSALTSTPPSTNSSPGSSALSPAQAGDGVSYQPILALIHHHFPDLDLALDAIGNIDAEVALLVAGITNMVLEMSKWDGMAGAMTLRTWVDALCDAHARIIDSNAERGTGRRKELVGQGITRGINQLSDVSLMTREFAPRIQIISLLKSGESAYLLPESCYACPDDT